MCLDDVLVLGRRHCGRGGGRKNGHARARDACGVEEAVAVGPGRAHTGARGKRDRPCAAWTRGEKRTSADVVRSEVCEVGRTTEEDDGRDDTCPEANAAVRCIRSVARVGKMVVAVRTSSPGGRQLGETLSTHGRCTGEAPLLTATVILVQCSEFYVYS
jgi:hypothetical protein